MKTTPEPYYFWTMCFGIAMHTDKKYFAIANLFYNAFIFHILIVIQCIMIAALKQN